MRSLIGNKLIEHEQYIIRTVSIRPVRHLEMRRRR
jgi:hypothetical protein